MFFLLIFNSPSFMCFTRSSFSFTSPLFLSASHSFLFHVLSVNFFFFFRHFHMIFSRSLIFLAFLSFLFHLLFFAFLIYFVLVMSYFCSTLSPLFVLSTLFVFHWLVLCLLSIFFPFLYSPFNFSVIITFIHSSPLLTTLTSYFSFTPSALFHVFYLVVQHQACSPVMTTGWAAPASLMTVWASAQDPGTASSNCGTEVSLQRITPGDEEETEQDERRGK